MNPADLQNTNQTNNTSEQPQTPEVPQLQNETPLDITIYPSNENPDINIEPQKIEPLVTETSIAPSTPEPRLVQENTVVTESKPILESVNSISEVQNTQIPTPNPINTNIQNTYTSENVLKDLSFNSPSAEEPFTSQVKPTEPGVNQESQKLAVIIGASLGVLIVGIGSWYLLAGSKKPAPTPTPSQNVTPAAQPTPISTLNPIQSLTLTEYQTRIDSLYNKYNNVISSNPIDLSKATLSVESVRFVSDEIFSITTELNELNVSNGLKATNQNLYNEFNVLVSHYDKLLMTYKATNTLTNENKLNFNNSIKASNDKLKTLIDEIKNLK